jgi:hypothetical protein
MRQKQQLAKEYFNKQKLSDDDVTRLRFHESLNNAHVAEKSGSQRVRHSPLMIWFCISLNHKLGRCDWTSLSKAFKLLSQSTLDKHKSVGSNDPDGFCHDIVDGKSKKMDKVQANESLSSEFKAWVCHGSLSYDSAKCPQPNVVTRSSTTSTLRARGICARCVQYQSHPS